MVASRFFSVALLLVVWSCHSFALKQELWFYLEDGNALYFDKSTPDLTDYAALLPKVKKYCSLGRWYPFRSVNYNNATSTIGDAGRTELVCLSGVSVSSWKSIRHLGNQDTDVDQISLYEGTYFEGLSTEVTGRAYTGISHKVESIVGTGTSDWMLFEGQFLEGDYVCFKVPYPGWVMEYTVSLLGYSIKTVGSVFKGCDLVAAQNYRNEHFLT